MEDNEKVQQTKEDLCAHYADDYDKHLGAIIPPIFQTTVFTRKVTNHGYTYSRVTNPTVEVAEQKIAALEEGEYGLCFGSGMGAISAALMHYLERDSHVIALKAVYTPTRVFLDSYMAKFGVSATFVSGESVAEFEQAIQPNTKVIYLESPVSNIFTLQDLEGIAKLAKAHGIITMIDNTWATPIFQNPLRFGIDIVLHSASKYMGGHSDILGGVIVGKQETLKEIASQERGLYGANMDPHQAYLLVRGLRTLPVRLDRHQETALKVASFLEDHPLVSRVLYPGLPSHPQYELATKQMSGFSGVMSFIPIGTPQQIYQVIKKLKFFEEGPSWGGFESLINSPGIGITEEVTQRTGIPSGLLRISVGLEHVDSLINDLDQALHSALR
ncbi:aminotransferase class I/II-fold pyridoxal phosphate-dependent enzyme [Paenibacillaceae bacterium]|nr:aminotransferase class I/II-fold pyridoxal phosphate-dependent enzyme [Paenibacillaceae bacterium]